MTISTFRIVGFNLRGITYAALLMCFGLVHATNNRDVKSLSSNPDFNKISLRWQCKKLDEDIYDGFKITYCEDQSWGPHRCRNAEFESNELSHKDLPNGLVEYSADVPHLRMATNYTVEVTPVSFSSSGSSSSGSTSGRSPDAKGRAMANIGHSSQILVQTKGFSAKAVSCLTNSTLVEVETGPYFRGKISVEGSQDPACATHGVSNQEFSKYRLNINHELCGSKMVNDSIRNYILVQENLPILTHSTRRFLVVCHYIPEAFTVSAGVSLPNVDEASPIVPVNQTDDKVDPSELFDSTNSIFDSRRASRRGKALQFSQEKEEKTEESTPVWAQMVLMVILVVGGVTGLSCSFWHFGKNAGLATAIRAGFAFKDRHSDSESAPGSLHTTVIVSNPLDEVISLSESETDEGVPSSELEEITPPIAERVDPASDSDLTDLITADETVEGDSKGHDEPDANSLAVSTKVINPSNWEQFDDYDTDVIIV